MRGRGGAGARGWWGPGPGGALAAPPGPELLKVRGHGGQRDRGGCWHAAPRGVTGRLDVGGGLPPAAGEGLTGQRWEPQIRPRWEQRAKGGLGAAPPRTYSAVTGVPVTFIPRCRSDRMSILASHPPPPRARSSQRGTAPGSGPPGTPDPPPRGRSEGLRWRHLPPGDPAKTAPTLALRAGSWQRVLGAGTGCWVLVKDAGSWYWVLGAGRRCWVLVEDAGSWSRVLGAGAGCWHWMLGAGTGCWWRVLGAGTSCWDLQPAPGAAFAPSKRAPCPHRGHRSVPLLDPQPLEVAHAGTPSHR